MWLTLDRLWAKDAQEQMQALFSHNLEMMAELAAQRVKDSRPDRCGLPRSFGEVRRRDFEFGASRRTKMKRCDDLRRWQPPLRTLLQVQLTSLQYRPQKLINQLPALLIDAQVVFQKDIAGVMRAG